jgi:hypothetical protein
MSTKETTRNETTTNMIGTFGRYSDNLGAAPASFIAGWLTRQAGDKLGVPEVVALAAGVFASTLAYNVGKPFYHERIRPRSIELGRELGVYLRGKKEAYLGKYHKYRAFLRDFTGRTTDNAIPISNASLIRRDDDAQVLFEEILEES